MNEWMENGMAIDVVYEKDKVMTGHQNWAFGAWIAGNYDKSRSFIKVKTIANMHEL